MLIRDTRSLVVMVFAVLGWASAAEFADDSITVERDAERAIIQITVAAPNGLLDLRDVVRGLARAARLDEHAAVEELKPHPIDLSQSRARWSLRAISAAIPDIRLRAELDQVSGEHFLRIRVAAGEAREKMLSVKSILREKLGEDATPFAFQLEPHWLDRPLSRPLVVLVHGYNVDSHSLAAMQATLTTADWPTALFDYPNDGPLAESSRELSRHLRAFRDQHPQRRVILLAHSMGGLVARAAIEDPALDLGNVDQLMTIGTPNHGTQWAEFPGGLDGWNLLQALRDGSPGEAIRESIADGLNEARHDLKPSSKFLRELNARPRRPGTRYTIFLGTRAPFSAEEVALWRERIVHSLSKTQSGRVFLPRVTAFLDDFREIQQEHGDGIVSVESGRLSGVDEVILLPMTHGTITDQPPQPRQQMLFAAVLERLGGRGTPPGPPGR